MGDRQADLSQLKKGYGEERKQCKQTERGHAASGDMFKEVLSGTVTTKLRPTQTEEMAMQK